MSLEEKYTTLTSEKIPNVFSSGIASGFANGKTEGIEEGKQAEYDAFWDEFQNKGGAMNYQYTFAYSHFTDKNYNPKYPIKCTNTTTGGRYLFYQSQITDTKVTIYAGTTNINYMFADADKLKIIRLLSVYESTTYSNTFTGCSELEEITFEGTIGTAISFAPCTKLSVDSMKNIISCLKNYIGTSNEGANKVTFASDCWTRLEASGVAPNGGTWKDYVEHSLGWNI